MTAEQGKDIGRIGGEVHTGPHLLNGFGEQAKRIDGDVIPGPSKDKRIVCIKQPVGVVAQLLLGTFLMQ